MLKLELPLIEAFATALVEGVVFVVGRLKGQTTTSLQSVVFDKSKWTRAEATRWLQDNDLRHDKVDETDNSFRYRQRDPGDFTEGTFRTIVPGGQGSTGGLAEARSFHATMLRPGIYVPGVGNPDGRRIRIGADFIRRRGPTMEGKKVDMEHGQGPNDVAGHVEGVATPKSALTGDVVIEPDKPAFARASEHIDAHVKAKTVPNVSVEIDHEKMEPGDGKSFDQDLVDGTFEGLGLVQRGACSDQEGCGIGMNAQVGTLRLMFSAGAEDPPEGERKMTGKEDPPGAAAAACACGGEGKALKERVDSLQKEIELARTATTAAQGELKTAKDLVAAYEKAEHDALVDAVKASAPEGFVLRSDATPAELRAMLEIQKANGSVKGFGRRTLEPDAQKRADQYKEALAVRLGLAKASPMAARTNLPPALARHNRHHLPPEVRA